MSTLADDKMADILRRETDIELAGKQLVQEMASAEDAGNTTSILLQDEG